MSDRIMFENKFLLKLCVLVGVLIIIFMGMSITALALVIKLLIA